MRTVALYCVLFGVLTALLILFATTGGPAFVESHYKQNHPEAPAGPPSSHSESHAGQTQREWHFKYPRDARNYGLDEDQCTSAFPGLYKEVDRAVAWRKEKGKIQLEDLEVDWRGDGIVRAMIYDKQLYVLDAHGVWDHNHRPRAIAQLHSLHRAITAYPGPLPNIEFTTTYHDSALVRMEDNQTTWSFSRLDYQESLFLMPDFGFWGWPDVNIRSYSELQHTVENDEDDFLDKIPRLVWRGATAGLGSHDVRVGLLEHSVGQDWADVQELVWANKTNIAERLLGMDDHCNYMFVAMTEGNTYSGRLKFLLNCHSILVSHPLNWIEHFHHLLVHEGEKQNYVKVKRDFADLPKKMNSLLKTSSIRSAEKIADNARSTFRERYLTPAAEACYWRALIRGWSTVQGFDVKPWIETEVPDYVAGKMRVKKKMRGAPFEAYVIMEEVDWELPAKPRRIMVEE